MIHDKMDHCKTAIPRMPFCSKNVDGALKMPITLTGILTHGHGLKAVAQYNVGVWASNRNTTIGLLDSILRMLEDPNPMMESLLEGPSSTDLFQKMLCGREEVLDSKVRQVFRESVSSRSPSG
jgi:hypothetical protein